MSSPADLRAEVLRFIRRGPYAGADDSVFKRLALAAFQHQFAENEPYRRYCERRGRTPETVENWMDVPAVPTAAFKEAALICGGPEEAETVFRTSGTTQGKERRGAHYIRDLTLYEASALINFKAHLLPDGEKLRALIIGPTADLDPESSLTWMLERVRMSFGTPDSAHYVDAAGLQFEAIVSVLEESESDDRPVMILGTAAAFAHLLEAMDERGRRFRLPPGSRLMETGGFKRQRREMSREEFYALLVDRLGLPELYCIGEYGMTEMCSQFYDNALRERALGRSPESRHKVVPPWVRTQIVDADELGVLPAGRVGVLRHFDLANLDSVLAIQTDDLGIAGSTGFEIVGRAEGSELRGCSIAMDEWLTAQR
jgi:hypothetical protein